jgi:hypothetical protein
MRTELLDKLRLGEPCEETDREAARELAKLISALRLIMRYPTRPKTQMVNIAKSALANHQEPDNHE